MFDHRKRGVFGEFERRLNYRKEQQQMKESKTGTTEENIEVTALKIAAICLVAFLVLCVLPGVIFGFHIFLLSVLLIAGTFFMYTEALDYLRKKKRNETSNR